MSDWDGEKGHQVGGSWDGATVTMVHPDNWIEKMCSPGKGLHSPAHEIPQPPIPEGITMTSNSGHTPHCCPVCGGRKVVPSGFYSSVPGVPYSTTNVLPDTCQSCDGTGIVWEP